MTAPRALATSIPQPTIELRAPRLVLYGGGFDPVHRAHLELARRALEALGEAQVCFVPAAQSPLKESGPVASEADRLAMLRLALKGKPDFLIDDLECRRGGVSFSIDTARAFKARFPGVELYWIVGADQFAQLEHWQAVDELVALLTFLVAERPGYSTAPPPVPGLRFLRLSMPLRGESSSQIRERCRQGLSVAELVPPEVEAFISKNSLYC